MMRFMLQVGNARDEFAVGSWVTAAQIIRYHKILAMIFTATVMWIGGAHPVGVITFSLVFSHGILWLMKEAAFPDTRWNRGMSPTGAFTFWFFGLVPYLILIGLAVERPRDLTAMDLLGVLSWFMGINTHFRADAFKARMKREGFSGLITFSWWKRSRHPNYLGELLTYLGYALLAVAGSPSNLVVVILVMTWIVFGVMLPSVAQNEDYLIRKYPGYQVYQEKTAMFLG